MNLHHLNILQSKSRPKPISLSKLVADSPEIDSALRVSSRSLNLLMNERRYLANVELLKKIKLYLANVEQFFNQSHHMVTSGNIFMTDEVLADREVIEETLSKIINHPSSNCEYDRDGDIIYSVAMRLKIHLVFFYDRLDDPTSLPVGSA